MSVFDDINDSVLKIFAKKPSSSRFVQYKHGKSSAHVPCNYCSVNFNRIFERGTQPKVPVHPHCDCYYEDIEVKASGSVSGLGENAPDVWLKKYGKLPDYYITKEEAIKQYGWNNARNTVFGKAPGKMIGGDLFANKPPILPNKTGRIWYECDVDYFEGKRQRARLLYSNDGLMFYSPDHYSGKYYFIE